MVNFWQVSLGDIFQFNKYDNTQWVKTSSRTARLVENGKVYYFKRLDPVLVIKRIHD